MKIKFKKIAQHRYYKMKYKNKNINIKIIRK